MDNGEQDGKGQEMVRGGSDSPDGEDLSAGIAV